MQFEELKAAVQPTIDQDLDALFAEYEASTGSAEVQGFLRYLDEKGLLTLEAIEALGGSGTLAHRQAAPAPPPPPQWKGTPITASPRQAGPGEAGTITGELPRPPEFVVPEELFSEPEAPAAPPEEVAPTPEPEPEPETEPETEPVPEPVPEPLAPEESATEVPDEEPVAAVPEEPTTEVPATAADTGAMATGEVPSSEYEYFTGEMERPTGEVAVDGEPRKRKRRRRKRRDAGDRRASRAPVGPPTGLKTMQPIPHSYDFQGLVGEGAMGQVLRAKDQDLHRTVAFKQMMAELATDGTLAGKFQSEVQITAQLEHPNIIPVYSLETPEADGALAYTMKLVKGKTFEDYIDECKALYQGRKRIDDEHSLTARLDHFLKACDAVHFAHERGIIHRDLKPENIMLGPYNEVYVMDWGISRLQADLAGIEDPVEVPGGAPDEGDLIIGTPQYMSPEQADGKNAELDHLSDQYALGLILYELLALKPAVTGKAPLAIVMRQQDGEKDPFVHITRAKIPPELNAIVFKATAKNPAARYDSLKELTDDIRRYLRNEAVKARPDTLLQAVLRWISNHRGATLVIIFMIMMLAAVTLMGSWGFYMYRARQQAIREEHLSHLITTVGTQSALIDGQFVKYQGLLYYIAASSVESMTRARPGDERIFYAEDFDSGEAERLPADVHQAKRYEGAVSFDFPVNVLAGDAREGGEHIESQVQLLASLSRTYRRALLRSHSEEAALFTPVRARRLMGDVGTPLAYANVGLANGVYSSYPGRGEFKKTFDPRKQPWYELAEGSKVPAWGSPYLDYPLGIILPCAMPLYDEEEHFLGVAAVELTFDYIIEKLLELDELKDASESYLLDGEGRVIVDSAKKGKVKVTKATAGREVRTSEYEFQEVVEAMKDRRSGYAEVYKDREKYLVIYNRMNSLGWYYVVEGKSSDLFGVEIPRP